LYVVICAVDISPLLLDSNDATANLCWSKRNVLLLLSGSRWSTLHLLLLEFRFIHIFFHCLPLLNWVKKMVKKGFMNHNHIDSLGFTIVFPFLTILIWFYPWLNHHLCSEDAGWLCACWAL
jgi:hypothetical protein